MKRKKAGKDSNAKMDLIATLSFMLLGAGWLLFIQGIAKALVVFNNKQSKMFLICIFGLICGIIQLMLVSSALYWGVNAKLIAVVATPFWYTMIQCASWAYSIRIQSMGIISNWDSFVGYAPWIILTLQIPSNVLYLVATFIPRYYDMYLVVVIVFSAAISFFEVFLYLVLLSKVVNVLEYRKSLKSVLIYEMNASLLLLVVFDFVLIVSKVLIGKLDIILRPFTYLLRIVIIIRFYSDLLNGISSTYFSQLLQSRSLGSEIEEIIDSGSSPKDNEVV